MGGSFYPAENTVDLGPIAPSLPLWHLFYHTSPYETKESARSVEIHPLLDHVCSMDNNTASLY
jgi:hypothetical protein